MLEANAAMRSIMRRDTAETYTSNKDWTNPVDPDAKVTKIRTA